MGKYIVSYEATVDGKSEEQVKEIVKVFFEEALEDYKGCVVGLKGINKVKGGKKGQGETGRYIVSIDLEVEESNERLAKENSEKYLKTVRDKIGGLVISFRGV